MTLKLLAQAQIELDDAFEWYERQAPGLGQHFIQETTAAFRLIERFPTAWHPLSADIRRCRLKRFPYGVIYTQTTDALLVLAIAHLHRKPDYWTARLPC